MKHPIQPIVDDNGILRFNPNEIVQYLLDNGGIDLNDLARIPFDQNDRVQFAQLIGYSLSGFGELSYVDDQSYEAAERMHESGYDEKDARIEYLDGVIRELKRALKEPMALLYEKHPDDFEVV